MPRIWCSISDHGFGHAAQLVPLLNELGRRQPRSHVILRTTVPASFFQNRLHISWEHSPAQQDVACIQQGPLHIDVPATWDALHRFHWNWEAALAEEMRAILSRKPQLILSNISYLAMEAGHRLGIPAVGCGSLSWDRILATLTPDPTREQQTILEAMSQAYARANVMIRLHPGMAMPAFPRIHNVGPVSRPFPALPPVLNKERRHDTRKPLVFIAFGGIQMDSLPWARMHDLEYYDMIADIPPAQSSPRIPSLHASGKTFDQALHEADILLSKPGYGTVVEAVQLGKPFVYVRRHIFADEPPLVEYAHRFGRACELSQEDFLAGRWEAALQNVLSQAPPPHTPPDSGVPEAVDILLKFLP